MNYFEHILYNALAKQMVKRAYNQGAYDYARMRNPSGANNNGRPAAKTAPINTRPLLRPQQKLNNYNDLPGPRFVPNGNNYNEYPEYKPIQRMPNGLNQLPAGGVFDRGFDPRDFWSDDDPRWSVI